MAVPTHCLLVCFSASQRTTPTIYSFYWRGSLRRRHSESLYRPQGGYSGLQVTGMIEWGRKLKPLIPCVRFGTLNNHSLLGGIYLSSPYKGVHPSPLTQVTVMLLGFTNSMKQWNSGENKILEQPSSINVTVVY